MFDPTQIAYLIENLIEAYKKWPHDAWPVQVSLMVLALMLIPYFVTKKKMKDGNIFIHH